MPGLDSSWEAFSWVFPVATQALAAPRLRASRRWRTPSRVWVRPAATAVSPRTAPRYRLPFLALARPLPLPDWWSCGARPPQQTRCGPVRNLVMPTPVSATASWAARRPQPGTGLGLGQLLLVRGQQLLDHLGQVLDAGGQPVDARQHLGQQGGVRR